MIKTSTPPTRRFTLDKGRARTWLRHAAAAATSTADPDGGEPPAGLEGPRPDGELPGIYDGWNPVDPGNESDVWHLVRCAVDAGIIGRPETHNPDSEDWDLDFAYSDDSDGGSYFFLIWVNLQLKLATRAEEMRRLGQRDATGIDAALAILDEARTSANATLDALDRYMARPAA